MKNNKVHPDEKLIREVLKQHPTPFYLYDKDGIRNRNNELFKAFSWNPGFKQYYAVKALPNPRIVALLAEAGSGADCSSLAELEICERLGITGESIFFTSNNTTQYEFERANRLGAIINVDTPELLHRVFQLQPAPGIVSIRFNPGPERVGNVIIGDPKESKFGCTKQQIIEGFRAIRNAGIPRVGLHAMIVSNELGIDALVETADMLFRLAVQIKEECGVSVDVINLGGGIGVAYRPHQESVDIPLYGLRVREKYESILVPAGLGHVKLATENGRAITGPFGYLVSRVINVKQSYKRYIGLDACMSNLMRPGMYGAYHHITVLGKPGSDSDRVADVVGSLCENNDKFAIDRPMPEVSEGDVCIIHDSGAHSHSMGFQYNGRLRSAEFLYDSTGKVEMIRRAETFDDYFATLIPKP